MSLRYVTTNEGKIEEALEYLDSGVTQLDYDYTEIQADDLESVAAVGAREAFRVAGEPVIVDDAGLFIDGFSGFPGPYSSYVEDTVGVEDVWHLTEPKGNRGAAFRCVVAYAEPDADSVETFEGVVPGSIVAPRGDGGFGYDPIFEHGDQTFAEMDTAAKNAVSHRGRALAKLADWLAER